MYLIVFKEHVFRQNKTVYMFKFEEKGNTSTAFNSNKYVHILNDTVLPFYSNN